MRKITGGLSLLTLLLFLAVAQFLPDSLGNAALWPIPEIPAPIYIRSDGSIEPHSAFIQRIGEVYILTGDLTNAIEVQRDHIVIDGNGFSITQTSINTTGFMIPAGFYPAIRLDGRTNVTVKNVKIQNCLSGITLQSATNITLTNNTITGTEKIAIFASSSKNCTFSQNSINSNDQGMLIINSTCIHIFQNDIKRNRVGIQVSHGGGYPNHYIAITRNNISKSWDTGIMVDGGYQLIIIGNNLAENSKGLSVSYANCIVHHNNFVDNTESVKSNSCAGPWDNGRTGNFWSDYNGSDLNGDGIGDMPYIVETPWIWIEPTTNTSVTYGVHAQDNYPLIAPLDVFSIPIELPEWAPLQSPSSSPFLESPAQPSTETDSSPFSQTDTEQQERYTEELLLSAFVAVVVSFVVFAGLLVYFKKHKGRHL
ncbi:MAG: NosD domain-containing protein [Candidatus Bathyarchaeia archaeon]